MEMHRGSYGAQFDRLYENLQTIELNDGNSMLPFSELKIDWKLPWRTEEMEKWAPNAIIVGDRLVVIGEHAAKKWLSRIETFKELWTNLTINFFDRFDSMVIDNHKTRKDYTPSVCMFGLFKNIEHEDLEREIKFWGLVGNLRRMAYNYSVSHSCTGFVILSHDRMDKSFFFEIIVNKHPDHVTMYSAHFSKETDAVDKREWYCPLHGGLIFHKDSKEWGIHT